MVSNKTDLLIIGSGLAGLALALKCADQAKVIIISKEKASDTNTAMAQGGIAAAVAKEDSVESHIADTLAAGAGLCDYNAVRQITQQAPDRITDLQNWGVHFEQDLTLEGGHTNRRIFHFEDHTGAEIHRALLAKAKAHANIQILEDHFAIDLILNKQIDPQTVGPSECVGCYSLNKKTGEVEVYTAKATVIASGGAGRVYKYTSNWNGATGDGIVMAYRAGARIANLEFMQFHPTCLYHKESRNFLISEALRGEGGELVNSKGQPFMKKYHELGSLAPRDIVARGIDAEMKKTAEPCVFLDMTKLDPEFVQNRFPKINKQCLSFGIDMTKQPIPVVPAAHYLCGGIMTDISGKTDIGSLWAIGEAACTGLHGANRLASNSLLEAVGMAHNSSIDILQILPHKEHFPKEPLSWKHPQESDADEMIVIHHMWDEIRSLMWNYVGIVRSNKRLLRAQSRLKNILSEVHEYYSNFKIHSDIIELRNIAIMADLTVECALSRKESRGIHYNLDYQFYDPSLDKINPPKNTIILR